MKALSIWFENNEQIKIGFEGELKTLMPLSDALYVFHKYCMDAGIDDSGCAEIDTLSNLSRITCYPHNNSILFVYTAKC